MTNNDDLALKLKAAAEKATPGEWRRASTRFNGITATPFSLGSEEKMLASTSEKRDAEFITEASPTNILALLAERDADKAENVQLRQRVAELERQLIAPLPIGELIQRLSDQTGEDWSAKYLEARTWSVKLLAEPFYPDDDIDCPLVVELDDVKAACVAAGISLIVGGEQ